MSATPSPDKPTENPLVSQEKACEEFRKEVEEKIKIFSKIDLKSKNKDTAAYKQALEEAINE